MSNDIYHPDDKAKLDQADADLKKAKASLKIMEKMVTGARCAAAPTLRNRYRYHRVCDEADRLTAAFLAVTGLLFAPRRR